MGDNQTVLVTGGTRGIGLAISNKFKLNNYNVLSLNSKDIDLNNDNLSSYFSNLPPIDICVNCAGINIIKPIEELDIEDYNRVLNINLRAPFIITKIVSENMKKQKWGRIINIASIWGHKSKPGRSPYSASKSGIIGLTKTLALELAPYNILVNSISPGFTDTELTKNSLTQAELLSLTKNIPLKRMATPEEIANITYFMGSSQNTYITGQDILIDGGFTIQ
jgi:3-oxoacyl-[acyl-carrier protein] reductase